MNDSESHLPEQSWEWEDVRLDTLDYATASLLEELAEHHIDTVGALLGATQGLSMPVSVSEHNQDHAETLLTHLLEDVPAALLEQYKASQTELPPPGILPGSDPLEEVQQ